MSAVDEKIVQFIFSDCIHGERPLWILKLVKRGKTSVFVVNERLREAKAEFLIEHDKKEFKYCIITLYIEETPDTKISDTANELKQVLAHNCFYILGKAKTYINFIYQEKQKHTLISHSFRGVLGLIPFLKAIN